MHKYIHLTEVMEICGAVYEINIVKLVLPS